MIDEGGFGGGLGRSVIFLRHFLRFANALDSKDQKTRHLWNIKWREMITLHLYIGVKISFYFLLMIKVSIIKPYYFISLVWVYLYFHRRGF
ncbi:hypothetical protein Lalb_Chr06g0167951 [Lupinus albus]|uniref:Uncharacterized protein n=1 Tax=Lupinus albus TaxID=3870 RepID=A0A6A4QDQ9_LUPAL|nr:hypothetical protein Lalb_Chr06g0167951 [Lupinus albus]